MGYVMGSFWGRSVKHILFLCRHKSSNRVQPTYQTSPEPTKSRKKTKSLYISILKLLSQAPCLYMCDPSILLFHPPHQILLLLATESVIFTVDFSHLMWIQIFPKIFTSLCQKSSDAMISSIFYFSTSPQKEQNNQQSYIHPSEQDIDLLFYRIQLC